MVFKRFLILTPNGSRIIEAEDIEQACQIVHDDHTGYDNIYAVVKIEDTLI